MNGLRTIFAREFFGYFRTPVAYVFLVAFILASIGLPWFVGRFFEGNDASLNRFFTFLPWVFLFLIPAVGMRLWSEEKRSGTWELLLTLPISLFDAVMGKFLAAWVFVALALALTLPMPLTVMYLGDPDLGPMLSGYFGALLMAGAYLGICSLASALTENQVIAFVVSVSVCLVLVLLGFGPFNDFLENLSLPVLLVDAIARFSFVYNFEAMFKGLITVGNVTFFVSLAAFCLSLNLYVLKR
ncbi:MAG: ABC transporter permease subunit [Opitutales bacterium]|nr:ABC transporter permease subunit [Opitutales bacterium]